MKNKYNNFLLTIFSGFLLVSCNITNDYKNTKIETVIENIKVNASLRSYDECIIEGKKFDSLAAINKDKALSLYDKSAKILTDCDYLIQNHTFLINENDRMKNIALSIQNFLKAGNLNNALKNLKEFDNIFDKDLIYADGSSFVENIKSLLNHNNNKKSFDLELINNSKIIKTELKRIKHWSKN